MPNIKEYIAEHWQHWRFGEQDRYRNFSIQGIDDAQQHAWGVGQSAPISSTPPTDPAWRWGIDIAGMYDGILDAGIFKAAGGSWAIVKAADGTITARYVRENANKIKEQGLILGLYFWLHRNEHVSGAAQAAAWAKLAREIQPAFCAIDYEWTSWNGKAANPGPSDLRAALEPFEQAWGKKAWIYSAPGYLAQYPAPFPNNPLWLAQYGVAMPMSVTPWGNAWSMWQQSDRWGPAAAWGIDPNAAHVSDGDVMQQEKFDAIFGGGVVVVPPPPDEGGSMARAKEKLGKNASIRSTPTAEVNSNNDTGQKVVAYAEIDYVAIVDDLNHKGNPAYRFLQMNAEGTRFVNYFYPPNGQRFDLLTLPPTPPPPAEGDVLTGATAHFKKPDGTTYDQELEVKQ